MFDSQDDEQPPQDTRALCRVAHAGDADAVKAVLDSGKIADANASLPGHFPALMDAVASGDAVDCCRLLMDAGADPLRTYLSDNLSALAMATRLQRRECALAMLERVPDGAYWEADAGGFTPAEAVAGVGDEGRLAALLAEAPMTPPAGSALEGWPGRMTLSAARGGSTACLRAIASLGVDIWAKPLELMSHAASHDRASVVRMAADAGHAGLSTKLLASASPLGRACTSGATSVVRAMHESGVDVLAGPVTRLGLTAMMVAARHRSADIVRFLLGLDGADKAIAEEDYKQRTAVVHACQGGSVECVRLLLEAGSSMEPDPGLRSGSGRTCIGRALRFGHTEVADFLEARGLQGSLTRQHRGGCTILHDVAEEGQTSSVRWLLKRGVPGGVAHDPAYSTPLAYFVDSENEEAATLLLDAGARAHFACRDGSSALSVACENVRLGMLKLLLRFPVPYEELERQIELSGSMGQLEAASIMSAHAAWLRRGGLVLWRRAGAGSM